MAQSARWRSAISACQRSRSALSASSAIEPACAAFAPSVNSYKRLVRQGAMATFSWAPVFNSYGSNNRTNSVRVPMGGGRCESRNADGAVNPYLAGALVLAWPKR